MSIQGFIIIATSMCMYQWPFLLKLILQDRDLDLYFEHDTANYIKPSSNRYKLRILQEKR